jgi:hypothetical protein
MGTAKGTSLLNEAAVRQDCRADLELTIDHLLCSALLAIELCAQQMHKIDWPAHLLRGGEIDGF